ncbi:uroporphyrinogen-III C-methyltransferase [Gorillibacterium sp. sgz5001074]|uniref:uroporphyrinogen-III C-methyltransferase n=1 Tax=Gorillibacterium sp. sgz5001074 TaxID=3446695 RepID=UPI003F66D97C
MSEAMQPSGKKGTVYLIGAGPGDPKLITVKGMECIARADAVVYDRLASPRLLKHMKPGAEKIYVGKLPDRHTLQQEEINQLLVDLALAGKTVARLKGGDPSIFGRVGEEAELLAENGVPFEIVPGITSAISVPAYAGIPVTHRDYTSSLAIITGHEDPAKTESSHDWSKLATATGTSIFLMGVSNLAYIRDQLVAHGRSPDTPVALIRWGTRVEQETLVGTLSTIVEQVREANFQSPAIIIVGEVVKLRETLAWYEKKPLFGKRVLVTRARSQASELADRIDDLGGEAVEFPVIRLRQPEQPAVLAELDAALNRLEDFDWVLFTSPNGVHFFFERLKQLQVDVRRMWKAKVASVGPKTAELLAERGIVSERLPVKFQGEGLLEAILPELVPGQKALLPRADIARDYLPVKLKELGLDVTEVDVYESVVGDDLADEVVEMLKNGEVHITTFTSSSTVTNLIEVLKQHGVEDPAVLLNQTTVVCIGPLTAETAEKNGLTVDRMSAEATIDSLVQALNGLPR